MITLTYNISLSEDLAFDPNDLDSLDEMCLLIFNIPTVTEVCGYQGRLTDDPYQLLRFGEEYNYHNWENRAQPPQPKNYDQPSSDSENSSDDDWTSAEISTKILFPPSKNEVGSCLICNAKAELYKIGHYTSAYNLVTFCAPCLKWLYSMDDKIQSIDPLATHYYNERAQTHCLTLKYTMISFMQRLLRPQLRRHISNSSFIGPRSWKTRCYCCKRVNNSTVCQTCNSISRKLPLMIFILKQHCIVNDVRFYLVVTFIEHETALFAETVPAQK